MRMKFLNKEYQWSKIQSAPRSPETEINSRLKAFQFDSVSQEKMTDSHFWIF